MRLRPAVLATFAVVAFVGVVGLHFAHPYVMPDGVCTACHGPAILQPIVMGEDDNRFTGPDACEPCHTRIYHIWTKSPHCRAMMCPGPTTIFSHFSPDTVAHSYNGFNTKMISGKDGYFMMAPGPDGKMQRYKIDLVVGIRDQQSFLTKFPDGRYQVLPSGYDLANQTWYDATEGIITSEHVLNPDERFYWTNRGRTWNRECFPCHLSGMEKNYNADTDTYDTKWRDLGIDCEACHGPGREHARLRTVRFWRKGKYSGDHSLLRLRDLTPRQQVEVCANCHARKNVLASGYLPGDDFYEFYRLALFEDTFVMPDGRFWGLMYDVLGFMQSPCYEKGGLVCTHCHDPHASSRRNDIRDSFEGNDDRMCLPCHADLVRDPKPHTFHKPDGAGSRCRSCHMQMLPIARMQVADHTLSIPIPENTVRWGIPNACNQGGCHPDSSAQSMVDWCNRWYGSARRDRWTRADVLYRAKALDTSAVMPLMRMLGDTAENIVWRANAAQMLGTFADPRAVPALIGHVDAADPLLHSTVVFALLRLGDPRVGAALERQVMREPNALLEQEIAGRLGWWWRSDLGPAARQVARRTWEAFVRRTNEALGDRAGARTTLGNAYARRGEVAAAEREYTIALRIDPRYALAADGLAGLYAGTDRLPEALVHGRRAVEIEPDNAAFRVNLAATLAALGATADARAELERALAIDPDLTGARRDLGRILAHEGRAAEARAAFAAAVARDPSDAEAQYLLGQTSASLGRRAEAIQAYVNALFLAPARPEAGTARARLADLAGRGSLPGPTVPARTGPRYRPPKMRVLDPHALWPAQAWRNYTPVTTARRVLAQPSPATPEAGLDSVRVWLGKADQKFYPADVRRAFVVRALGELGHWRVALRTDRAGGAEAARLRGTLWAVLSEGAPAGRRSRAREIAAASLAAVDTTALSGADARARLGRSWYRLARAYNAGRDWRRAVPAFATAARLVPDSFTDAISWFFIATSHDRLGERDLAVEAYVRSDASPYNSVRGYRCAKHALVYPFQYFPD